MNRRDDHSSGVNAGLNELVAFTIGLAGAACIAMSTIHTNALNQTTPTSDAATLKSGWRTQWFINNTWTPREPSTINPESNPLVILVHGLDEPGDIWGDLAPALTQSNFSVVRYIYQNDQPILQSARGLREAIDELTAHNFTHASIVAHSMGGLVSREALTNPTLGHNSAIGDLTINHLILVGTPNEGSHWARLQEAADIRERVQRWITSDSMDLAVMGHLADDGNGEAGTDLTPGSTFLTTLNARPMPPSLKVTCLVGRILPEDNLGSNALGDGVVTVESASLDGCTDIVELHANHRSLIRTMEYEEGWRLMLGADPAPRAQGIDIILDRLSQHENTSRD